MYLVILKNYHSTIEDIINTHEDVKPNEVWTVWRDPWQRFISGVWHDIVQHQTTKTPRTTDHYFTEIKQKLRDKKWVKKMMLGTNAEHDESGHMQPQWLQVKRELNRHKITEGSVRVYMSLRDGITNHFPGCNKMPWINPMPSGIAHNIEYEIRAVWPDISHIHYFYKDQELWKQLNQNMYGWDDIGVDKFKQGI